ncbi:2'-5' RNA ligase family protein [Rufibacter sp. XAAS-G3-1]|uniref:2'-5' RNA ligase family protein n=1 Tax=Rufibacter sp. XAAS-G3-1 TaxID=2729134 RepID=UPI0015E702AD|nr:mutarotase [Rufibacter sp. XAAS-G3-1]
MNLQDHYTHLWEQAAAEFAQGRYELDLFIDSPADTRRGVTLLARPDSSVKKEIHGLLKELARLEPAQYYYPAPDIHLTVLSIISCYPGFTADLIEPQAYTDLLEEALRDIPSLEIAYAGLTASPSCVLVQGFPKNDALEHLRENVRKAFRASKLQQSLDQRYTISTAHSTVVRFRRPLARPQAFLQQLKECRKRVFGVSEINTLELVCHDWYQRKGTTQTLATFDLK